jgi:hypothetical protein
VVEGTKNKTEVYFKLLPKALYENSGFSVRNCNGDSSREQKQ